MTALLKVDAIYGETKSTKTSRLGDGAEYWAEKTGKPARGVFCDTGGYGAIEDLVEKKLLIPFILSAARGETLIEDMNKLTMGWWPKDPSDPKSVLEPPKLDGISCMLFDSGTSMCDLMDEFYTLAVKIVKNAAGGETMVATHVKVPEMPKDSYIKSGDYVRRFKGRSDYMGIQSDIAKFIKQSAHLSVPSIWSFGETTGKSEYSDAPCGGPDFYGEALTGRCGKWFGNILHLSFISSMEKLKLDGKEIEITKLKPYMFTARHTKEGDLKKLPYMAGTRVDRRLWSKVPSVLPPDLKGFYKLLDELAEEARSLGSVLVNK